MSGGFSNVGSAHPYIANVGGAALTNIVTTFNARQGDVVLVGSDITGAGGVITSVAPTFSVVITAAGFVSTGLIQTHGYTVAGLPAAGVAGRRAFVTDATAPTWLGTLTGGGAVHCPVFDNGSAWVPG